MQHRNTTNRWWVNRDFALLWSGQACSNVGDALCTTTLALAVATITQGLAWAAVAVSGVLLAALLPTFVVRPFAGVLVDRLAARRVLLWVDALRAVMLVVFLAVLALLPALLRDPVALRLARVLALWLVALAISIGSQFFGPAQIALLADLVPVSDQPRASGLSMITSDLATIIGPSLAAPLFFSSGLTVALALDALSFGISLLTLILIKPSARHAQSSPHVPRHFWGEFREGLQLFATQPTLRTVALALAVAMAGLGALTSLNIWFVTRNLHAPLADYAYLGAGFSAGSFVGSIVGTLRAKRMHLGCVFAGSMIAVGVLLLLYARLTSFIPALALFTLLGVPNALNVVATTPLVLATIPRAAIGRVFALLSPAWSGVYSLSILGCGALYSSEFHEFHATILDLSVGPLDTLLSLAGLLTVLGGCLAWHGLFQATGTDAEM